MSWGFIPRSLVRGLWEKEVMENFVRFPIYKEGQTGMNTTSESHEPYRLEVSAPADRSGQSLSKANELLEQATTALRQAVEAASKAHAHEVIREWNPVVRTTPGQEPVSPFTARLTLYSGLLGTLLQELASIAPISPAEDVTNSSKPQESSPSSPPKAEPFSRSSDFEEIGYHDVEPPINSIVLDDCNDAWQRTYEGWTCAYGGDSYRHWDWRRLCSGYTLRLIYGHEYK